MAAKKNRNRSLTSFQTRTTGNREVRDRVYIFCEGQTEEWYYKHVARQLGLTTAVIVKVHGGSPIGVVREACEKKKSLDAEKAKLQKQEIPEEDLANDTVWAIFDTENLHNNPTFHNAVKMAKDNNVTSIITNPCIEYWFLLHFQQKETAFHDCNEAERQLKAIIRTYQKAKDCSEHFPLEVIKKASANSKRIYDNIADEPKFLQTSSNAHELIDFLIKLSQAQSANI